MLASSSVDTLTTPSQIPSEEILTYFEQQIKKNFALADISIKSGDIGEEGGYWVICMESLEAWKILYQETLVNSKKQWGKELENIPKQVANLEQELR